VLIRFLLYGCVGVVAEVFFTAAYEMISGTRRPPIDSTVRIPMSRAERLRAQGHTTLWMFPIYGSAALLFEPAHDALRAWPWLARGGAWMAGLFAVEAGAGLLLRATTGRCPWDYSYARTNIRGVIRLDYAPLWFAFGLGLERLHDLFAAIEPAVRAALHG
jgi:hypothetical protein